MKRTLQITSGAALLIATAFCLSFCFRSEENSEKNNKGPAIQWYSYSEGSKLAEKKNKKIFIDVYTDWCGWCKHMDKTTFRDAEVIQKMNDDYIAVKLDAESTTPTVYQGKVLSERELAVNIFKANAYPTTVYLDKDETILSPVPGYQDVEAMKKILTFFGKEHYKTKSWQQFEREYNEGLLK